MRDFRGLKVWKKGHALTLAVYRATRTFPAEEKYGLTSQLRRAAASIPTNLAEGCGRSGERELARFASIAAGSASEVEYLLLLSADLGLLDQDTHTTLNDQVVEIKKMLASFHRKLKS